MENLSRITRRLHRKLVRVPLPPDPSDLVDFFRISDYATSKHILEPWHAILAYTELGHPDVHKLTVSRICFRKESQFPHHQGLILHIALPNGTRCGYITIDRYKGRNISDRHFHCIKNPQPECAACSTSESGASDGSVDSLGHSTESPATHSTTNVAKDKMIFSNVGELPYWILRSSVHTISDLAIPLANVLAAADVVSQKWPRNPQCSFYALCVTFLLLGESGWDAQLSSLQQAGAGSHHQDRGRFAPVAYFDSIKSAAKEVEEVFNAKVKDIADQRRYAAIQQDLKDSLQHAKQAQEQTRQALEHSQQAWRRVEQLVEQSQRYKQQLEAQAQHVQEQAQPCEQQLEEQTQQAAAGGDTELKAASEVAGVPQTN